MDKTKFEKIIRATIDGTEYTEEPTSRMEELLLELKEAIEAGGGGGEGTTDYNKLKNKPTIGGVELSGNLSLDDVGVQEEMETMSSEDIAALWGD